jgi:hypothetical protein
MEPTALRADAVSDNQPDPLFGRGSQRLVYVLLMTIGAILMGLGAYARWQHKESWLPELCIALGVAIAAPGILSYLYRKYMLEEIKLEIQRPAQEFKETAITMVDAALSHVVSCYRAELNLLTSASQAGLLSVHQSRKAAVQAFLPYIEDEKNEILIVGSSLKGLLQEEDNEYQNARTLLDRKLKQNIRVRFLMTHPIVADLRARQENRKFTDIGTEIVDSLNILKDKLGVPTTSIKLYLGTPTCFGVKTSNAMLLNTYPYGREAFASPCFIVRKGGYFYEHFDSDHFRAWISAMALPVPASVDDLRKKLEEFADQIRSLIEPQPA